MATPRDASDPRRLDDTALLTALRTLVARSNLTEAQLLAHLAEVDERRLYLPEHTSMFAFCVAELGFSEGAAENRIAVARAARRWPVIVELLGVGAVHLSGLRVLVPHLTDESADELLAQAVGKSKRAIEELIAAHAPRPDVAPSIRKLPERRGTPAVEATPALPLAPMEHPSGSPATPAPAAPPPPAAVSAPRPAVITPLASERYLVQLTVSRALRDKLEEAKALLRHRLPSGDLETIVEQAVGLLIDQVKKERFGVGRKPRPRKSVRKGKTASRHIPDAIKRAVFERDGGQCTYVGPSGRRCPERGRLEFDHVQGFARHPEHTVEGLRLVCSAHNAHAADAMYGRAWMAERRAEARSGDSRPASAANRRSRAALDSGRGGGAGEQAGPEQAPTGGGPPPAGDESLFSAAREEEKGKLRARNASRARAGG